MNNYKAFLISSIPFWISSLIVVWVIRIVEFIQFYYGLLDYSANYFIQGIFFDFWFVLLTVFVITIIQLPFYFLLKGKAIWIFHVLSLSCILIQAGLSQYFVLMQIPLDASIYFLTWNDLAAVINPKDYIHFSSILILIIGISFYFYAGKKFKKIKLGFKYISITILLSTLLSSFSVYKSRIPSKKFIINNHFNYFIQESIDYFVNNINSNEGQIKPDDFNQLNPAFFPFEKTNTDYPLIHKLEIESDFANQFNLDKKNPPNVVIILVESLNSYFISDEQKLKIHLMPFLKDLTNKSLFFPNTISTCERTLNVLPSTLTSLPIAPDNISAMGINPMPIHYSLMSLLKKNYYSRFYCGVDLSFTNMNGFMNFNQTDYLVHNWNKNFEKVNNEFYNDGDIFKQSWLDKKPVKKKNRLDVFLTFTTHEPFTYPNVSKYINSVKKYVETSQLKESDKTHILKNARKFGSYTYLDDQLKEYFLKAKKNPEHKNTIYFIVGDHGSELCFYDAISSFHTSLVVYSPLLKSGKISREVVSHLDITPSIISLLKNYPQLNLPDEVPFAGKVLVINNKYTSNRYIPIKGNNLKLFGTIYGNYFLSKGSVFKIGKNLDITPVQNTQLANTIQNQLNLYRKFSTYAYKQNQIIPFNKASDFIKIKKLFTLFYSKKIKSDKPFENSEYITIGEIPIIPKKSTLLEFYIEIEYDVKNITSKSDFPNFVYNFTDKRKKVNNLIYWRGIEPKLKTKLQKNGCTTLIYECSIQLKDIKRDSNTNFDFYLFNREKKSFRINKCIFQIKSDVKGPTSLSNLSPIWARSQYFN